MTQSSDRLAQIEALLATVAESNAASAARMDRLEANLARTEKITESNARAIKAWGDRIEEGIEEAEEVTSQQTANLAVRIEDNAHNQGIDRVRFDALHEEHSQRFNTLLEEARADRQRADQRHEEHSQRFDVFLAEARADRQRNETEHRAFTENIQMLLAEIARLWQRVAG